MRTYGLFWFLFVAMIPQKALGEQELVFSAIPAPLITESAYRKLEKAYDRLGIKIEIVVTEASRALVNSLNGTTDGELIRIRTIGDRHPSLLRVEVPLIVTATYAYTNRPELVDRELSELTSLRAGYVRGVIFAEQAARKFSEVWAAEQQEQLFRMLEEKRIDFVFVAELPAGETLRKLRLKGIYPITSSRREYQLYHYLHERHRDLVPLVEKTLEDQLTTVAENQRNEDRLSR